MSRKGGQAVPLTLRTMGGLLGVSAAALFAATYWFDITREELLQFLGATLVFMVVIVVLAGALVLIVKLPGFLRRRAERRQRDESRNGEGS